MDFSFTKDSENFNIDKDYYNDLPGKVPPEKLDPLEEIPPRTQPPKRITIQVSPPLSHSFAAMNIFSHFNSFLLQKPVNRFSRNLIDLNSPPPDPNYVNDKSSDVNSNTRPPADVFGEPFGIVLLDLQF